MLKIQFHLSVMPQTLETFQFFKIKVQELEWSSESIPGSSLDEKISFKTVLVAQEKSLPHISVHLIGYKSRYGALDSESIISKAVVYPDSPQRDVPFKVEGRDIAHLDMSTLKMNSTFDARHNSCFAIENRDGKPVELFLAQQPQLDPRSLVVDLIDSISLMYKSSVSDLKGIRHTDSDMSRLHLNRLYCIQRKRMQYLDMIKSCFLSIDDENRSVTHKLDANDSISELTIKSFIGPNDKDSDSSKLPQVDHMEKIYSAQSAYHFENKLTLCASAIKKDLEGYKEIANSYLLRDESSNQIKLLFQKTKLSLCRVKDVVQILRKVSTTTYGAQSAQVEILDNCIGKINSITKRSSLHTPEGPFLKNVTFLYQHISSTIDICQHILETFEPINCIPQYLSQINLKLVAHAICLVKSCLDTWLMSGQSKRFKSKIWPFIKSYGFIFRVYLPHLSMFDHVVLRTLKMVQIIFHDQDEVSVIQTSVSNCQFVVSIPVPTDYVDSSARLNLLPLIIPYSPTPSIKPDRLVRQINSQTLQTIDLFIQTLPFSHRPLWPTNADSHDWLSITELTNRSRWIENYISQSHKAVFGCCWFYHHIQGDFTENELDVLDLEANISVTA